MLYINGDKDYALTYYKSNNPNEITKYYSFNTLQKDHGIGFVRDVLGVNDFESYSSRMSKGRKELNQLIELKNKISTEEIPLQDISSPGEIQDLINTVSEDETALKTFDNGGTQTDIDKREMDGVLKAMTSVKEELANELAKLNEKKT